MGNSLAFSLSSLIYHSLRPLKFSKQTQLLKTLSPLTITVCNFLPYAIFLKVLEWSFLPHEYQSVSAWPAECPPNDFYFPLWSWQCPASHSLDKGFGCRFIQISSAPTTYYQQYQHIFLFRSWYHIYMPLLSTTWDWRAWHTICLEIISIKRFLHEDSLHGIQARTDECPFVMKRRRKRPVSLHQLVRHEIIFDEKSCWMPEEFRVIFPVTSRRPASHISGPSSSCFLHEPVLFQFACLRHDHNLGHCSPRLAVSSSASPRLSYDFRMKFLGLLIAVEA